MIDSSLFPVINIWHGANPESEQEKEVLTFLTRLEFMKSIPNRRHPEQLIAETKRLIKTNTKDELLQQLMISHSI